MEWREVSLGIAKDKFVGVQEGIASGDRGAVRLFDLLTEKQRAEMRRQPVRRQTPEQ
jgi:hypothetical protein